MDLFKNDYNLSPFGGIVSGEIIINKEKILIIENKKQINEIPLDNISELYVQNNIASAQLVVKLKDDKCVLLCGFTMEYIKAISEMCKCFNYYLSTGNYEEIVEIKKEKCEKCGRYFLRDTNICLNCVPKTKMFKRYFELIGKYKGKLLFAGILLVLTNLCYIIVPYLNRILIDGQLTTKTGTFTSVLLICGLILLARTVGEIIFIISANILTSSSQKLMADIRVKVYANIQKLSMNSLSEKTTGALMQTVSRDVAQLRSFLEQQGRWMFEQGIIFIGVCIILFSTNPMLAAIIFVPFPLVFYITMKLQNFINLRYRKQWRLNAKSNTILHDIISGIKVVKSCGKEKEEIEKYSKVSKDQANISALNEKTWSLIFPSLGFFIGCGEFLILYFGGKAILGQTLTLGELVQFIMYTGFIYGPIRSLVYLPRWLGEFMISLVKVVELIDEKPNIENSEKPVTPDTNGDVSFNDVVFGYKSYEPILKQISSEIKSGEMIGLVGASGSGKSTFINLLLRLYDVDSGSIKIDKEDIRGIDTTHLHSHTGVVFQDTFLFVGTIFENICYTKQDATFKDVIAAAKITYAHEFIMKLPDGYNTIVGEKGHSLSGGERQRIAIARAIINNPALLILDEATSSLDAETEDKVQKAMQTLIKGRTTIAIAHKLSTLKNANRLFVMDKGKIVEKGTHKELLEKKGIYYELVTAQLQMSKKKDNNTK